MNNDRRGLIKFLLIVILAVAALAYFHVDLRAWAEKISDWWQAQDLAWFKSQFEGIIDRFR